MRKQRPSGALAEEPDEYDHHPRQPSRERPTERQSAHTPASGDDRTTRNPSSDITLSYETRGRAPSTQSRPPHSGWPDRASHSEARPPQAGPGSAALDGVCVDASAPPGNTFCTKGSSGTCSACKGHRPCIKAGATKRVLLTREYSLHCCIRGQMHKGCRGVLRPARRNCRQTVRCEVRRYGWSVS